MGYSPWGRKESDTTEGLTLLLSFFFFKHIYTKYIVNLPFQNYGGERLLNSYTEKESK